MEIGYILAAIFAVIWIAFEIADFLRKKKQKKILKIIRIKNNYG